MEERQLKTIKIDLISFVKTSSVMMLFLTSSPLQVTISGCLFIYNLPTVISL